MNERQMQFRVGVIVFATMIIGGLLVALSGPSWTGWLPWGRSTYKVGIKVDRAPGVAKSTPVHKNGILIGRVKTIDEQPDGVLVWAEINAKNPLYKEYEPHIRTNPLSDATIEFEKRVKLPANSQPIEDGYVFDGKADGDPLESLAKLGELKDQFGDAAKALKDAGQEVKTLAASLNTTFGDNTHEGRINHLVETTDSAMRQFEQTMRAFNDIIGDPQPAVVQQGGIPPQLNRKPPVDGQQPLNGPQPINGQPRINGQQPVEGQQMRQRLREGINQIPDAIHELRVTMDEFRTVLKSANTNLKNLEGFTEPLGQKGADIAGALMKAVSGLDQLLTDLNMIVQALNNRKSTVGRLLYDNGAGYENVNTLMSNINVVLKDIHDLAFRLQPVVNDARIFMDKVATEPGRIITGGLNPSSVK
jgi:phospholipid/cholesterol/gamma-HCH transport system substrate-binding protein